MKIAKFAVTFTRSKPRRSIISVKNWSDSKNSELVLIHRYVQGFQVRILIN